MLLHRLCFGDLRGVRDRPLLMLLRQRRQRDRDPVRLSSGRLFQFEIADLARPAGRIGENDDGRLQALGPVHGHHPHLPARIVGVAFEVGIRRVEPFDEAREARHMRTFVGEGGVEQFVDRIVRLTPQSGDELAASLPRPGQQPCQQRLRGLVVGAREQLLQLFARFHDEGIAGIAQMPPQAQVLVARDMREQIVLRPSHQRRGQEVRQRQIVERLRGEPQRRHQVLDRQRRAQPQPVHPGDRDTLGVQFRHDLPRKLAALAQQDHDVAGRRFPVDALCKHERLFAAGPAPHLFGNLFRQQRVVRGQPVLFALVRLFHRRGRRHRLPQGDEAAIPFADVIGHGLVQSERLVSERMDRAIDETQHRLRRAVGAPEVEVAPAGLAAVFAQILDMAARVGDTLGDLALGPGEVLGARALEPEDRLLVIADGEDRPQPVPARALSAEEIVDQRIDDVPLSRIGILRLVDQDVVELPVELVADPVGRDAVLEQMRGAADQVVEIEQSLAPLRLLPPQREGAPDFERRGEQMGEREQRLAFFVEGNCGR